MNTPVRVDIDVDQRKASAKPVKRTVKKSSGAKHHRRTSSGKAFEAEHVDRKARERVEPARAHSDDEGAAPREVDLGREFREQNPHGKLKSERDESSFARRNFFVFRRWKSEYQSTYKPFWKFDYKNGKWYKDSSAVSRFSSSPRSIDVASISGRNRFQSESLLVQRTDVDATTRGRISFQSRNGSFQS